MARKVTIETSVFLKVNTGNYETIDLSKTVKEEIEFETPADLMEKSKKLDNMAAALLKQEADVMMASLGRKRIMKINGQDTPVALFESHVSDQPK